MPEFTLTIHGRKPVSGVLELAPPSVPYYMHKEDREALGGVRSCAPCPAVMVLKDDSHVFLGRQWQYYLRAINHNMDLDDVYILLDYRLAFANMKGFTKPGEPRADWFHNKDLSAPPPQLDKVRTCSRNTVTGTEGFSLLQALRGVVSVAKMISSRSTGFLGARNAFLATVTASVNILKVWTFDSRLPPPLKPGRTYPSDISRVNPDDYLYMPERDREKFLVANVVRQDGTVMQFPRGALYPWFEGGRTIASFLPHISNHGYGEVAVPLTNFVRVASVPSPYRLT